MGTVLERIDDPTRAFIAAQQLFFVATAPSGDAGHVNISPKGHADTFAVIDDRTVAYLDLTGSGVETIAHLRDNGRITIMFCAFSGTPNILRLFGAGRVVVPAEPEFAQLVGRFPDRVGARAIVVVDVDRVQNSCGFAVPTYTYAGDRDMLEKWAVARTPERLAAYRADKNAVSMDGLPGLDRPSA